MKLRYLSALSAFCLLAFASSTTNAQELPFSLRFEDTTAVVGPAGYKDFKIHIANNTGMEQTLYVERVANGLPNGSWSSNICTADLCYPTDVDQADPIVLAPKQAIDIKLTISGGPTPNESATVELKFSTGLFGPAVTQQFSMTVATSSVFAESRPAVRVAPVPNPASTSTLLPANIVSTEGMSVRIYDPLGRLAADLSSSARLGNGGVLISLETLAEGTYFYQLDANGYRGTGTLVVNR